MRESRLFIGPSRLIETEHRCADCERRDDTDDGHGYTGSPCDLVPLRGQLSRLLQLAVPPRRVGGAGGGEVGAVGRVEEARRSRRGR